MLKEAYASVRGDQRGSLTQLQTLFRRFVRVRSIAFGAPLTATPQIRDTYSGAAWPPIFDDHNETNEDDFRLGPVNVGMGALQALENLGGAPEPAGQLQCRRWEA